MAPDRGVFVLYRGPNGETLCREASPAETREIRSGESNGLRQINHLKDGSASVESASGLTIILRATAQLDANAEAKAAFITAAAKWEALIKDPITIAVDVDYGTTFFGTPFSDPGVIGATSSPQFFFAGNYTDVRNKLVNHASSPSELALANALPAGTVPTDIGSVNTVFVPSPLLRALGGLPPDYNNDSPSQPITAPKIAFNSAFGFDFEPSDGITGNRTDFDAVAVHEIGHLLGFNSEVGDRELNPSGTLAVTIWDLFRFRPGTANFGNFSSAQRILSSGGEHVHFSGGPELGLSTAKPDGSGGDGRQASHWKDDSQNGGNYIGIMDPAIPRNRREVMTANDQDAIDFFGYLITASVPPANDNFVNAQALSGNSGAVSGTNIFATRESGELTFPIGTGGGKSVWYNWTAPGTGQATFDTNGSTYDTLLAVYTGASVNALTHIASNDDISDINDPEPRNIQSRVIFSATAGTTYRIQVDGFDGDQGSIVLNWSAPAGTPSPSPSPAVVQFSAPSYAVGEGDLRVDVNVIRSGDTSGEASVAFATSDTAGAQNCNVLNGLASSRCDYETNIGAIKFAAGETSKTLSLFIIDDAYAEGAETFAVSLSNPSGASLGPQSSAAVTINDNGTPSGVNPIDSADFFVRMHYLDFLNREPDAAGLNFWINQITSCGADQQCIEVRRVNVSASFFLSIEFQQTGYLVERLYKTAYGDATGSSTIGGTHNLSVPIVRLSEFLPDTQEIRQGVVVGQTGWEQVLENNKLAFTAAFVQRDRFTTAFPASLTPLQFVNMLNTNAGNPLSVSERDQLVNDLSTNAKTRAQVLRAVAEDADLVFAESNRAYVLMQFFGYLRRNPNDPQDTDYSGYDFWLAKLNLFNGDAVNAEMVKAFLTSIEYRKRFAP